MGTKKLNNKEKFSYGFGNLAANLLITTANVFITYFYTEQVGIAAATAGTILLFARVFDGISDLVMGVIVDKTNSKHGKARPWLKWMAIPFGISLVLLFNVPNFGNTGNIFYSFITYVIAIGIIYTAITVPYNAMIGTMTNDPIDRGHLSTIRTGFGFTGVVLVNIITLPLVSFYGGGQIGWLFMATTYAIIAVILWYLNFYNSSEYVLSDETIKDTVKDKNNFSLIDRLKAVFKNKYWLMVIVALLISNINSGIGAVNPYYAEYILHDPTLVGALGAAQFTPVILMMFIIGPIMKYISKRNLIIIGSIIGILGRLFVLINPSNLTIAIIGITIAGIGQAPMLAASYAMLGDTVDFGELKTGLRTEGISYSAATFGEKVGNGMGGLILGLILGVVGYVGGQATQTTLALNGIISAFIFVPVIFGVILIVVMYFYDLDKKHEDVLNQLNNK